MIVFPNKYKTPNIDVYNFLKEKYPEVDITLHEAGDSIFTDRIYFGVSYADPHQIDADYLYVDYLQTSAEFLHYTRDVISEVIGKLEWELLFSTGVSPHKIIDFILHCKDYKINFDGKFIQYFYGKHKATSTWRRFLNRIGFKRFTEDEINLLIAISFPNVEIVRGEDIRKCYLISRHSEVLNGTCMSLPYCQPYLQIYVDHCELAVVRTADDKINARALLWTFDNGQKFLDRIYGQDMYVSLFKKYAEEQGFAYKAFQNSNIADSNLIAGLKCPISECVLTLPEIYEYYPFVDTVKFLSRDQKKLHLEFANDRIPLWTTSGEPDYCECCGSLLTHFELSCYEGLCYECKLEQDMQNEEEQEEEIERCEDCGCEITSWDNGVCPECRHNRFKSLY